MSDSDDNVPLALKFKQEPTAVKMDVDESDEDMPLAVKLGKQRPAKVIISKVTSDSSDDDVPLAAKFTQDASGDDSSDTSTPASAKRSRSSTASKSTKKARVHKESSKKTHVQKEPAKKTRTPKESTKQAKANGRVKKESDSDSDIPLAKRTPPSTASSQSSSNGVNGTAAKRSTKGRKKNEAAAVKKEEQDEDEEYQWWMDNQANDGSVKWNSLAHNGVMFPPPYKPHGIRMKYAGREVALEPDAEEMASFFAALLHTDNATNPIFQTNFFADFQEILRQCSKPTPIKEFSKCDFTPIHAYFESLKEERKRAAKEDREAKKEEKRLIDEQFGYCTLDGRREKVGNFRIEPPGLFRGRGAHPKTGCLKRRLVPEEVTLNLSKNAPVPPAPAGHKWGKIVHDNTVTWLATWRENVTGSTKYVFLAANSSLKGQSDMKKFEMARELKHHIDKIRRDYGKDLRSEVMQARQRATAMYLIDRFALRAGNEKGGDEADTVGCCTLRFEHVTRKHGNTIVFDFLGKDSIRYYREVEVDPQVAKNIALFKKAPKQEGDPLFDRLSSITLNKHLASLMPGLSAKVFRTYNASHTFQKELEKTPSKATVAEKVLAYNRANREVAILCNHQRSIPKTHDDQMSRGADKLRTIKYQRRRVKMELLQHYSGVKRKRPEILEPESDLDDEWCIEYEASLVAKEQAKAEAKIERTNEERAAEGQKPLTKAETKEMFEKVAELKKRLAHERKTGKVEPSRASSQEKLEKSLDTLTQRLVAAKTALVDKDENKTTALGTSKINYLDPRITAAWCHKYDVPLDKMFNATLRDKFRWAMTAEGDWQF